ncbi:hypothetical protein G6F57_023054 [Rhizopus arrhizus]|nr:hypothetical protein G6F57_023054 [Rhizopus arrhizus]
MRLWGTEYRRNYSGEDYWILRAHERAEALHRKGYRRVAITDVRFRNEAALGKALGGEVWRIQRPSADAQPALHQSEREVDAIEPDRVINNCGHTTAALAYDVLLAYHQATALHHQLKRRA